LRKLMIALDNVEATIWLFDSTIDLKTVKAKRLPTHHQAYRGGRARRSRRAAQGARADTST
jgi:hypothetical protein